MFVKGQLVTFLQNWDNKGTVRICDLVVYSCGKKQMILVDCHGEKFEGRHFYPTESQYGSGVVVPRLSREDAEIAALNLGETIVTMERTRMENCIAHYGYPESHGYTKAVRQGIAELHEARAVWR
jgi:hypothetical protein